MNERIEHLLYLSGLTASGCWDKFDDYDKDALEKLVRLIIQECAGLTLDHRSDDYYQGWLDYRDEIRQHFGVK